MVEPSPGLLFRAQKRMLQIAKGVPPFFLLIDIDRQMLFGLGPEAIAFRFPVSTAKNGIGNCDGSFQTPPGLHRVREKYGHNAPAGRIFRDREDSGENCIPGCSSEDLILSRILRLEGLEEGFNRGRGIDSFERYIYIHGTNHEDRIGSPNSHGCVCMRNVDVINLFSQVEEGTLVFIG